MFADYFKAKERRHDLASGPQKKWIWLGGSPDKRDLTYAEYKKCADHPYIGLMGGGPRMLRRKAVVHNGICITEDNIALMGEMMHPRAASAYQQSGKLTAAWSFRHNDDLMDLTNIQLQEESIEDFEQAINARQAAIIAEKAKDERSTTSTFAFSSFEFVLPGVNFNMLFELDCNEAQLGLYLLALDNFAQTRLGGHTRNGLGIFVLNDVLLTDESLPEEDQQIKIFENGRLNRLHPVVATWLDAWASAAANLDVATIEEMMTLPADHQTKAEKEAAKAAKKLAKAAAEAA